MQTLTVSGVEDGAIVATSPTGERFRVPVDAALLARLQSAADGSDAKRLSPREIQAHVRAGLTAQQVAAMTGVPVASIERFVGPVLAERAYIVESALAVRLPPETEGARSRTFGAVMGERLDALAAAQVRWTSAKEPSGWVLSVGFLADDLQHDARWRFDPKHMRLEPENVEASTLSQQGVPAALTPRLRAIEPTAPVTVVPFAGRAESRPAPLHGTRTAPAERDDSRFDSAAFRFPPVPQEPRREGRPAAHALDPASASADRPTDPEDALPPTRSMDVLPPADPVFAPRPAADRRDPAADRRTPAADRREPGTGRRDPATDRREPAAERRDAGAERPPAAVRHLPFRGLAEAGAPAEDRPTEPLRRRRDRTRGAFGQPEASPPEAARPHEAQARPRRGRTTMPSWDEIVFGRDE